MGAAGDGSLEGPPWPQQTLTSAFADQGDNPGHLTEASPPGRPESKNNHAEELLRAAVSQAEAELQVPHHARYGFSHSLTGAWGHTALLV